jgi:hypothetical protein
MDQEFDQVRQKVTPREVAPAEPICTLFKDGSMRVEGQQVALVELQRCLLGAALTVTGQTVQRATMMEQVLRRMRDRYDGFDTETNDALVSILGPVVAQPPPG